MRRGGRKICARISACQRARMSRNILFFNIQSRVQSSLAAPSFPLSGQEDRRYQGLGLTSVLHRSSAPWSCKWRVPTNIPVPGSAVFGSVSRPVFGGFWATRSSVDPSTRRIARRRSCGRSRKSGSKRSSGEGFAGSRNHCQSNRSLLYQGYFTGTPWRRRRWNQVSRRSGPKRWPFRTALGLTLKGWPNGTARQSAICFWKGGSSPTMPAAFG